MPQQKPYFVKNRFLFRVRYCLKLSGCCVFSYGYTAAAIIDALRKVLGLANVTAADPELIATALDWAERGVDFADDLHLAASRECSAFVTFDAAFISTVNGLSPCVV